MQQDSKPTLWQIIKSYFNVSPDKNSKIDVITQITDGINFQGVNIWILICAIFIASLGLNVNSTAVIIGAMLISPLMGPIIGMGLAIGIADLDLFKQSIKNYLVSTFISVVTAAIYFTLYCYSVDATPLYSRLWSCCTKYILLPWGILPLFHQYCFYRFYNLSWCTPITFS